MEVVSSKFLTTQSFLGSTWREDWQGWSMGAGTYALLVWLLALLGTAGGMGAHKDMGHSFSSLGISLLFGRHLEKAETLFLCSIFFPPL